MQKGLQKVVALAFSFSVVEKPAIGFWLIFGKSNSFQKAARYQPVIPEIILNISDLNISDCAIHMGFNIS